MTTDHLWSSDVTCHCGGRVYTCSIWHKIWIVGWAICWWWVCMVAVSSVLQTCHQPVLYLPWLLNLSYTLFTHLCAVLVSYCLCVYTTSILDCETTMLLYSDDNVLFSGVGWSICCLPADWFNGSVINKKDKFTHSFPPTAQTASWRPKPLTLWVPIIMHSYIMWLSVHMVHLHLPSLMIHTAYNNILCHSEA